MLTAAQYVVYQVPKIVSKALHYYKGLYWKMYDKYTDYLPHHPEKRIKLRAINLFESNYVIKGRFTIHDDERNLARIVKYEGGVCLKVIIPVIVRALPANESPGMPCISVYRGTSISPRSETDIYGKYVDLVQAAEAVSRDLYDVERIFEAILKEELAKYMSPATKVEVNLKVCEFRKARMLGED